jgi:hypothetical protein
VKTTGAIVALLGISGLACAGAPLGGGNGTGGSAPPCTTYTGCGTGAGGTGGVDPVLCGQIDSAYASALKAAYACTPGAPDQCQVVVATVPTECPDSACGQQAYVNDKISQIEPVRGQWLRACDMSGIHSCPNTGPCDPPLPPAVCVPDGPGATAGTCVPYGSDAGAGIAPDGGESCDQLAADYTVAVNGALDCTVGAPNQCQTLVDPTIMGCTSGCEATQVVNDATGVNAAWMRWAAQCALDLGCTLSICDPPPVTATCVPDQLAKLANGGICVTATPLTTN